jgi:hypothetical protein
VLASIGAKVGRGINPVCRPSRHDDNFDPARLA